MTNIVGVFFVCVCVLLTHWLLNFFFTTLCDLLHIIQSSCNYKLQPSDSNPGLHTVGVG